MKIKLGVSYSRLQAQELLGVTRHQLVAFVKRGFITPIPGSRNGRFAGSDLIDLFVLIDASGLDHFFPNRRIPFEGSPAGLVRAVYGD